MEAVPYNRAKSMVMAGTLVPDEGPGEVQSLMKLAAGRIDLAVANVDELERVGADDIARRIR